MVLYRRSVFRHPWKFELALDRPEPWAATPELDWALDELQGMLSVDCSNMLFQIGSGQPFVTNAALRALVVGGHFGVHFGFSRWCFARRSARKVNLRIHLAVILAFWHLWFLYVYRLTEIETTRKKRGGKKAAAATTIAAATAAAWVGSPPKLHSIWSPCSSLPKARQGSHDAEDAKLATASPQVK